MNLQDLHEKYQDRGLVVLGLNCADEKKIAADLLRKRGTTYLTILDTSQAARTTAYRRYRTSGVPVSYIIDREGRVAAAWYGYAKGERRGLEVLEKLGVARSL